jgi:hypothetical protein
MAGIPPYFAFLLGGVIGLAGYGPVKRWIGGLRRAREQAERPDAQGNDSQLLLVIFTTMHPAPWIFVVGVPFALYQLTFGPVPLLWLRLMVGMLIGIALILLYETLIRRVRA